jgi:hypothetical protein
MDIIDQLDDLISAEGLPERRQHMIAAADHLREGNIVGAIAEIKSAIQVRFSSNLMAVKRCLEEDGPNGLIELEI